MAEAEKQLLPPGEEQPPKKSKMKRLIMLVVILVVLGGGGFAAWTFFLKDMIFGKTEPETASAIPPTSLAAPPAAAGQPAVDEDGKPLPPPLAPAPGLVLTMEPFMVNLADTNARRLLRIIVAIDVENDDMRKEVEARMPRIRDALLLLFGSKFSHDLGGTQGKLRLRMEILKVVNNVLGVPDKIAQAYYQEFVVQ